MLLKLKLKLFYWGIENRLCALLHHKLKRCSDCKPRTYSSSHLEYLKNRYGFSEVINFDIPIRKTETDSRDLCDVEKILKKERELHLMDMQFIQDFIKLCENEKCLND